MLFAIGRRTYMVKAELVYIPAAPKSTVHLHLSLALGATVAEALQQSGIFQSHPETEGMAVGIFSKLVPLDTVVKAGDRLEIYKPLQLDPKERRRKQARKKK